MISPRQALDWRHVAFADETAPTNLFVLGSLYGNKRIRPRHSQHAKVRRGSTAAHLGAVSGLNTALDVT